MGANFSTLEFVEKSSYSSSSSSSILTFHSTAKWKAHFHASKETNKLLVIDFTATWCGPCKAMDPIIKEFAAKYTDVEFIKIDVDELMKHIYDILMVIYEDIRKQEVAQAFQVQTMPTFILMKKGKVVEKVVGAKKEELQKLIEKRRN